MTRAERLAELGRDLRAGLGTGTDGDDGRERLSARVGLMERRARMLERRREGHALAARWVNDALAFVRMTLLGGQVVAIDTGRDGRGRLMEVGIARLRNGRAEVATHRDRAHRHDRMALHGPVNVVDGTLLRGIVSHRCRDADLVVFHGAEGDLAALGLDASRVIHVDTSVLGPLLDDLAKAETLSAAYRRHVGGTCPHAHESGNDAWRTLELVTAMALGGGVPAEGLADPEGMRYARFGRADGRTPARTWERAATRIGRIA